jgi:nucleotide-binding universal stress UspA family protein
MASSSSTPSSSSESSPSSSSSSLSTSTHPTTYHSLLTTLEQEEAQTVVDQALLEDLKEKYEIDQSRNSLALPDSLQQYASALIKSKSIANHFDGISLLSQLTGSSAAALASSPEALYSFALGYFRIGEYKESLVKVNLALEIDPHHRRATLLKQILSIVIEERSTRKVLVYVDGGDSGVQAFLTAVRFVTAKDQLYLLSVFDSPEKLVDTDVEGWEVLLEDRKSELIERSQQQFVHYCRTANLNFTSVCGIGAPKDAILQLIQRYGIDVLVIGQDQNANIFFKLTAMTLADSMVANAPCQVLVAKNIYGTTREKILQEYELSKLNPTIDSRPAPPRRAHTHETTPVSTASTEVPISEQVSRLTESVTSSVTSFLGEMFGEPKTPERPDSPDSTTPSSSAPNSSSFNTPPSEPAPEPPSEPKKDRLSLDSIKKFGQQLPFFSNKPKE